MSSEIYRLKQDLNNVDVHTQVWFLLKAYVRVISTLAERLSLLIQHFFVEEPHLHDSSLNAIRLKASLFFCVTHRS